MVARLAMASAVLLGVLGCNRVMAPVAPAPPPHPIALVAPPGAPPEPSSPDEPDVIHRCDAYRAESPPARRFCRVTDRGGLWAITVDEDDAAQVVHEDVQGRRVSAVFRAAPDQDAPSESGEEDAVVFDFDGDGDPELFFKLSHRGYEDRVVRRVFVTAGGGAIVPYASAPPDVEELRDVDGDGRPDAVVRVEYGAYKGCDYCTTAALRQTFLGHSRGDGSFSFTDEVAQSFVRERCPARPLRPVVREAESESWEDVACSRILGGPARHSRRSRRRRVRLPPDRRRALRGPLPQSEGAGAGGRLQPAHPTG